MNESAFLRSISSKRFDPAKIAEQAIGYRDLVEKAIEGLGAEKATIKYRCEKILRAISAMQPGILYSRFGLFSALLESDSTFLKWGAIATIANLARADRDNKFEPIFDKYFSAITGPVMITAANTIRGAAKIAAAKPALAGRISKEILKVEGAKYKTPECRNVAIGHAIDSLDQFFALVQDQGSIIRFVERQLRNTRAPVRKRAERFLNKRKNSC
jgi:hypothetical protein